MADREMLFRAVQELVVNACKFSRPHSRTTVQVESEGDMCCILVEDQGSGISPDRQAQLFQPLFQPPTRDVARYNGMGIGLKLVRAITDQHGGRIQVASQPGRGSRFTLSIPLAHQ
jgi:signal transduction histidine kinase